MISFCAVALFQLAVVFPFKLGQAVNSRENVTKVGCGTNGPCLSESSLTEEPQARPEGQQTSLGLTKPHFTHKDGVNILETFFFFFFYLSNHT